MAKDSSQFQDLKARIESYENLKKEFYELDVDEDEKIDEYIKLFQQFNDEFLDAVGELGMAVASITAMTNAETNDLISFAKTFIGHTYIWGAEGEISDSKGLCFDCSGFITYLMKEKGLMPKGASRLVVSSIPASGYFYEVPWNSKQPGDVLCNSSMTHVVLYEGNNQIIHASNSAPYPKGGVKESSLYFTGKAYRIKGYGVE